MKASALLAVVVKVGVTLPGHFIVLNHVTVLDPLPSCRSLISNTCPVEPPDKAKVLFPPRVTVWIFPKDRSKVTVPPSVAAVIVWTVLAKVLGPVRVSVEERVMAVPEIFEAVIAAELEISAFNIPQLDLIWNKLLRLKLRYLRW